MAETVAIYDSNPLLLNDFFAKVRLHNLGGRPLTGHVRVEDEGGAGRRSFFMSRRVGR